MVVESLKTEQMFPVGDWRGHVQLEFPPATMDLLRDPAQGLILVTGHLGNWEVGGQFLSQIKPIMAVRRRMNNPYVDRILMARLTRERLQLIPRHDVGMGRLRATLRNGNLLVLVIDQHARTRGMLIDFLGKPAWTHVTPAVLHLLTGTPVCTVAAMRTGPMKYTVKAFPPLDYEPVGDREEDTRAILDQLNRQLEEFIRTAPEQYLWAYKRWRHRPPDESAPDPYRR